MIKETSKDSNHPKNDILFSFVFISHTLDSFKDIQNETSIYTNHARTIELI
jgi:hypothetical protein